MNKLGVIFFLPLLALLAYVAWIDPRVPHYHSVYDPSESSAQIARWYEHLRVWPKSPRFDFFQYDAQTGATKPAEKSQLGPPDWARRYLFGKFGYTVDVQVRGSRIHYLSWGCDEQKAGGAWSAVGEGALQPDGRYFSIWSCLDLTGGISNGGGAWLEFSTDKKRIFVRYYHDTLPFGETACEEGEAEEWPRSGKLPLEGRVPTFTATQEQIGETPFVLWGRVVDSSGNAIAGAAVKRRARGGIETTTNARGFFKLELEKIEQVTLISAGKLGYRNASIALEQETAFSNAGPGGVETRAALATLVLERLDTADHRDYEYVSPHRQESASTPGSDYDPRKHLQCGNCHRDTYLEWKNSRHASMARNPLTRATFERDAMPSAIARGETTDSCTPCHSPSFASILDQFNLNGQTLVHANGVHLDGNHCDFCHKIEAVSNPEKPGLAGSIRMLRPNPLDQRVPGSIKHVFGPLPDVSYLFMGAAYNPLFETGALCAGCHEHTLDNGVVGQGTYSEWKQTKFAKPGPEYRECQSCHMPQYRPDDLYGDEAKNTGREIASSGTRFRPLTETHKHTFVGSEDPAFMREALSMNVDSRHDGNTLRLIVTLENRGAGHAVPTGHGLKRIILSVEGLKGRSIVLDPTLLLPAEERDEHHLIAPQSGIVIGRRFAGPKLADALAGKRKGDATWAVPFWRAEYVDIDDRLWPGKPRTFEFALVGAQSATVRLVLRRASPQLLEEQGFARGAKHPFAAPLETVIYDVQTGR